VCRTRTYLQYHPPPSFPWSFVSCRNALPEIGLLLSGGSGAGEPAGDGGADGRGWTCVCVRRRPVPDLPGRRPWMPAGGGTGPRRSIRCKSRGTHRWCHPSPRPPRAYALNGERSPKSALCLSCWVSSRSLAGVLSIYPPSFPFCGAPLAGNVAARLDCPRLSLSALPTTYLP